MEAPRLIVAAVDFSDGSAAAIVRAADLAARAGATLHLLHADVAFPNVGDGAPSEPTPTCTLRLRVERFAAEALCLTAAGFDALGPVVAVVRGGTAPGAILRYVDSVRAALLVVGTEGRSGLARLLVGSVAEACVASAPCPVAAVPARLGTDLGAAGPILVGVDFGDRSRAALQLGQVLADLYGAPLEAVHAMRASSLGLSFAPDLAPVGEPAAAEAAVVRERLDRFAATVPGLGAVRWHVVTGPPARAVPSVAEARGAWAVVLGAHTRRGVPGFVGSVASATIRRALCPVLTLTDAALPERLPAPPPVVAG